MKEKEVKEFLELCKPFIKKQRKIEAKDPFVENGDLDVIYRLLNDLGVWEWLNETGRYKRI